ncbi:MAG: glycosyltransferase [Planctomycetales bacterium]
MDDAELRVMLLSPNFQARGRSVYTLRLADYLRRENIANVVITMDASNVSTEQKKLLNIREYPQLGISWLAPLGMHWLTKDLEEQPPFQLLHIQSRRILKLGTKIARRFGIPYIVSVHDYLDQGEKLQFDWTLCRGIIAVSESVKRDLCSRADVPAAKVTVIKSGVEVNIPEKLRPPLEPGRIPVVGTAGPLEVIKGIPFFLGAACRVLANGQDVEFLVAGAGPEEANLRRLARELGISQHVTFVPYWLDFTESLAAMDIFCLLPPAGTGFDYARSDGDGPTRDRLSRRRSLQHRPRPADRPSRSPSDSEQLADRILELRDPMKARSPARPRKWFARNSSSQKPRKKPSASTAKSSPPLRSSFLRIDRQHNRNDKGDRPFQRPSPQAREKVARRAGREGGPNVSKFFCIT